MHAPQDRVPSEVQHTHGARGRIASTLGSRNFSSCVRNGFVRGFDVSVSTASPVHKTVQISLTRIRGDKSYSRPAEMSSLDFFVNDKRLPRRMRLPSWSAVVSLDKLIRAVLQ